MGIDGVIPALEPERERSKRIWDLPPEPYPGPGVLVDAYVQAVAWCDPTALNRFALDCSGKRPLNAVAGRAWAEIATWERDSDLTAEELRAKGQFFLRARAFPEAYRVFRAVAGKSLDRAVAADALHLAAYTAKCFLGDEALARKYLGELETLAPDSVAARQTLLLFARGQLRGATEKDPVPKPKVK